MILGGLEPLSLLDFPGRLAAIVFTQGCNFRCAFCYNPMFVWPLSGGKTLDKTESRPLLAESDFLDFLKKRIGKLEGVVVTGGEPTIHRDLPDFIEQIKRLGFAVKLDTNGTNPSMLKQLIERRLLDYVAMDIKGPVTKYSAICGVAVDMAAIEQSLALLKSSELDYELRTTVPKKLLSPEDILAMARWLAGAKRWYLQAFVSDTDLVNATAAGNQHYTEQFLKQLAAEAAEIAGHCQARGLQIA